MSLNTLNNIFSTGVDENNGYFTDGGILVLKPLIVNKQKSAKSPKLKISPSIAYTKNKVFLEQVIFEYHPEYKSVNVQQLVSTLNPDHFRIERLIEEALAKVGGYNYIDEIGRDFDDVDNSDSKTTSLNAVTGIAEFANLKAKIGSLRVCVYNPFTQTIDFFYLRYEDWRDKATSVFSKKKLSDYRLRIVYSPEYRSYNQFDQYRVSDFTTLATQMDLSNCTSTV